MPISEEMLAWVSILLSVAALVLTLLAWRRTEARLVDGVQMPVEDLEAIRRSLRFAPPSTAMQAPEIPSREDRVASAGHAGPSAVSTGARAAKPQEFPLAKRIADFSQTLGSWCEVAGDKPMGVAMKDRRPRLDGLVREAMTGRNASSTIEMQFANEAAEIVMAVVSATDKDFADDPRRAALERQLLVLVDGAELALIDPVPGTPLDRERHESRGGRAGGESRVSRERREAIAAVFSRGVERPSAAMGSRERVLMKAEVAGDY